MLPARCGLKACRHPVGLLVEPKGLAGRLRVVWTVRLEPRVPRTTPRLVRVPSRGSEPERPLRRLGTHRDSPVGRVIARYPFANMPVGAAKAVTRRLAAAEHCDGVVGLERCALAVEATHAAG